MINKNKLKVSFSKDYILKLCKHWLEYDKNIINLKKIQNGKINKIKIKKQTDSIKNLQKNNRKELKNIKKY